MLVIENKQQKPSLNVHFQTFTNNLKMIKNPIKNTSSIHKFT